MLAWKRGITHTNLLSLACVYTCVHVHANACTLMRVCTHRCVSDSTGVITALTELGKWITYCFPHGDVVNECTNTFGKFILR